jgi:PPOX class probable F420-dependent enzyme
MRLTAAESRHRFRAARVARLATVDAGGRPHVVPVTFAVSDDDVVFVAVDHKPKSTRQLRRLDNIASNDQVCILVDLYDDDWTHLWWTRADCSASVLPTSPEAVTLLQTKYEQYAETPPDGPVIAAQVLTWYGWSYAPVE